MATLFGANEYGSAMSGLLAIQIAVWEFSLGVYLVVEGFRAAGLKQLGFESERVRRRRSHAAHGSHGASCGPAA